MPATRNNQVYIYIVLLLLSTVYQIVYSNLKLYIQISILI